jgi:polyferredoxin
LKISAYYSTGDAVIFGVTLAFPILISGLLYSKSVKKIDVFIKSLKDNSKTKRLNEKKANILKLKSAVQLFFLLVFFILLLNGKMKAWLFILVTGFFTSLIIGRVYCGWCCPVNTMNGFIDRLYIILRIKKITIPEFMQHRLFIIICFTLLVGLFILSSLNGKRLQLFTIITFSGVLVSILFGSSFWCSILCPWGGLFRIMSKYSVFKWFIDIDSCINCGICASACPSNSFQKSDNTIQSIEFSRCLQCLQCTNKCPKNAINLKTEKRQSSD